MCLPSRRASISPATRKSAKWWLTAGWLIAPREAAKEPDYSDIDLARAHLIRDLCELGVNDEAIPIVLNLVDQLHGLRRALREVLGQTPRER